MSRLWLIFSVLSQSNHAAPSTKVARSTLVVLSCKIIIQRITTFTILILVTLIAEIMTISEEKPD